MTGPLGNLIGDNLYRTQCLHEVNSLVLGKVLGRVSLASQSEISRAIQHLSGPAQEISTQEVFGFLKRLKDQLCLHQDLFYEKTLLETGFITRDSVEVVQGSIDFLNDFESFVREQSPNEQVIRHSYSQTSHRDMRIVHRPFRCVAAVVPQNASLSLSIIILASALYAGSRVIIRPSLQNALTGALLAKVVYESHPPKGRIEIVNCLASDFLSACYASEHVDVIHYIGSNKHALPVFTQAFATGKTCLLDGQGNGVLYLDESFPLEMAASLITDGATRFNGETCTSINGILVHDALYQPLKEALVESFSHLHVGNPLYEPATQIGPLFSEKQAAGLVAMIQGSPSARVLCGGTQEGGYFQPTVLEGVQITDPLVREGFMGPMVWIQRLNERSLLDWLHGNRFPLSDTILSHDPDRIRQFATQSKAARICVNTDPSVESMFEPWGGYPPSGFNPVSIWIDKYRQAFQIDGEPQEIMAFSSPSRT